MSKNAPFERYDGIDEDANKGNGNYTKYGAWYNGGRALSEPWFAEFVSWCFYEACRQTEKPPVVNPAPKLEGWKQQQDKMDVLQG